MNHVDREWIRAWRQERDRDRRRVVEAMVKVRSRQRQSPQVGAEKVGAILRRFRL